MLVGVPVAAMLILAGGGLALQLSYWDAVKRLLPHQDVTFHWDRIAIRSRGSDWSSMDLPGALKESAYEAARVHTIHNTVLACVFLSYVF
jgi:hypothetical protein